MSATAAFAAPAPPGWLSSRHRWAGHAQTLWGALAARCVSGPPPVFQRERWNTPDGDFIDADWLVPPTTAGRVDGQPLLVLFHGLEGSSRSYYVQAFADVCTRRGWRLVVPHFRGCSGSLNWAPRTYHAGDIEEIDWMLARCREAHGQAAPMRAIGVSLGGCALLRWAQEAGTQAARSVCSVAALSSPLDMAASSRALGQGFSRQVYTRMFLRTLVPKALHMLARHPGLASREALLAVRDLRDFDEVFTGPLHGFRGADDYYRRTSVRPHLHRLALPTLVLNALNDPFVPKASLPHAAEAGAQVTLCQPAQGGHVSFVSGRWPGQVLGLPEAVIDWMEAQTHG